MVMETGFIAAVVWALAAGWAIALAVAAKRGDVRRSTVLSRALGDAPQEQGRFTPGATSDPEPATGAEIATAGS